MECCCCQFGSVQKFCESKRGRNRQQIFSFFLPRSLRQFRNPIKASWTDLSIRHINFILKTSIELRMAKFPFFIIFISCSWALSLSASSRQTYDMKPERRGWEFSCDNDDDEEKKENVENRNGKINNIWSDVAAQEDLPHNSFPRREIEINLRCEKH